MARKGRETGVGGPAEGRLVRLEQSEGGGWRVQDAGWARLLRACRARPKGQCFS